MNKYGSRSHISTCCVPKCSNTSLTNPKVSFFSIPTADPERHLQWLRLLSLEHLIDQPAATKNRRICEDHFSLEAILYTNNRKILKKTAFPSRYLPSQEIEHVIEDNRRPTLTTTLHLTYLASKLTQTGAEDDIEEGDSVQGQTSASSANEQDSELPLATLKAQIYEKGNETEYHQLCDTYLTKDLAQLIKAKPILVFEPNTKTKQEYKRFCLNLYQKSPDVYDFYQKIFSLPSSKKLVREFIEGGTNVNDNILALKNRVNKMTAKEKNCSVLIGSLSLKANLCYNIKKDKIIGFQDINGIQSAEVATRSIVVMIRGIFSNWKQPIGYALVSKSGNEDKIDTWIENILKSLIDIGLNVRIVISSTDDDWIYTIRKGLISVESPYFFVKNNKIYHVFDVPELINTVRDTMLLHDLHFQGHIAKYEDILKFYDEDSKKGLRLASKLTKCHVSPTNVEKKQVKYAAQLLSKTVANSLCHYIDNNIIEVAEKGTVRFISIINDLFDALNASKRKHDDSALKKAFCGEESQKKFFKEMLLFLQSLKVIHSETAKDVTSTVKFIQGFLVTMKTIMLLFNDLEKEGHNFLLTRNLHREALDVILKSVISKNGGRKKVTSLQFISAYRKLFYSYLEKFTRKGSSKEAFKTFFNELDELRKGKEDDVKNQAQPEITVSVRNTIPELLTSTESDDEIEIVQSDYTHIDTPEKHILFYICGYLLQKTREHHKNCQTLADYVTLWDHKMNDPISKDCNYQRYEQLWQNNLETLSVVPYDSFVRFVEKMDEVFVEVITSKHLSHKISETICNKIAKIQFNPPCICFPKMYVIKLFTRIRIFYTIRVNNTQFKTQRRGPKCFFVPKI